MAIMYQRLSKVVYQHGALISVAVLRDFVTCSLAYVIRQSNQDSSIVSMSYNSIPQYDKLPLNRVQLADNQHDTVSVSPYQRTVTVGTTHPVFTSFYPRRSHCWINLLIIAGLLFWGESETLDVSTNRSKDKLSQRAHISLVKLLKINNYLQCLVEYFVLRWEGLGRRSTTWYMHSMDSQRKFPPAVGVWHADSFVNKIQITLSRPMLRY